MVSEERIQAAKNTDDGINNYNTIQYLVTCHM